MIRVLFILSLALISGPSFAPPVDLDCLVSAATLTNHEYTNGELLSALFGLQSGARAEAFHPKLVLELKRMAGNPRLRPPFTEPQFAAILKYFRNELGPKDFVRLVGELAKPVTETARDSFSDRHRRGKAQTEADEVQDMNRGYGYRLLSAQDSAFTDPLYLARMLGR